MDRRRLTLGLAALTAAPGCAVASPAPRVLVNLAQMQAPPEADNALLAAEADVARRMTVPVFLNEAGPYEFVVDTGANRTVLAAELAEPLKLDKAASAAVHGIAGVEPAPTVMVGRLRVGAVSSRRLTTPLLPAARLGAQGLLGVDVLKDRRVMMDFQKNELRINAADARLPPVTAGGGGRARPMADPSIVVVPARQRFGQLIIIDADVGGAPVTAFLDSGSQNTVGNLALRDVVVGVGPDRRVQTLQVQLISATGQTASGELAPLPPIRLGGLRMGGLSAVFADLHIFDIWDLKQTPAILIGIDVMRHFHAIELDFARKLVSFHTPPRALRHATPAPSSSPVER